MSFVFDRLTYARLKDRCLNGVRQGGGKDFAIYAPVTGYAGLTAPGGISAVLNGCWRLHAADAASGAGCVYTGPRDTLTFFAGRSPQSERPAVPVRENLK